MLKNTMIKRALGIGLLVSLFGSFSSFSLAKKVEPEKTSSVIVQKKDLNGQKKDLNSQSEHIGSPSKVNINQAGEEELTQKLNGIGKHKARAIIDYRQKYGAFNSIENILEVQGIGPSFLEKNKDKLEL